MKLDLENKKEENARGSLKWIVYVSSAQLQNPKYSLTQMSF